MIKIKYNDKFNRKVNKFEHSVFIDNKFDILWASNI